MQDKHYIVDYYRLGAETGVRDYDICAASVVRTFFQCRHHTTEISKEISLTRRVTNEQNKKQISLEIMARY